MWQKHYSPPVADHWQGRPDAAPHATFAQIIQLSNLLQTSFPNNKLLAFGLIGFNSDEGVKRNYGRSGANIGPNAIRTALAKLAIHRNDIICYDLGNIACLENNLEEAQSSLADVIYLLLAAKIVPIVLGGGHEIAWGHYQGITQFTAEPIGIINFDAHLDMREPIENLSTSGTPFLQIAHAAIAKKNPFYYFCFGIQAISNSYDLLATAKQFGAASASAESFYLAEKQPLSLLKRALTKSKKLYTSLCLDVFSSAYAPGVSAPQPLGLTPWQVIPLLRRIALSGQSISYDIAELAPNRDIDQKTAKLAAALIFEIIHHHKAVK